ncbi:Transmembrane emp24 domain-containing protein p24beta3 [Acorus gramineus]|uniref:Transmembrane emp24 domain-containing protein p24beta3 n=1 Tax=Acorus gramineus TaxID=55184 RepID=A0AAV9B2U0_ACOGR|nr:Transmembrane emp24 domain-containing protein p24beta3 [Acorus gramineus]
MERGRSTISTAGILWALFLLVGIAVRGASGLAVTVTDMECVYEYVLYDGDTVSGNFVVVDHDIFWSSDHPGIDLIKMALQDASLGVASFPRKIVLRLYASGVTHCGRVGNDSGVTSPAGNTVHSMKGTSGDKFEFKAPRSGMYKFCFHNPHATPETVSFYIHVGHIPNEHDLAKDEHLDPVNVKIAELREALESVTAEQKYLRARDTRHRHTNESTRKRLIVYTLMEYMALVCASGLQVVYIRRLFSKSVGYNRV